MHILTEEDAMADEKIWAVLQPLNGKLTLELWNDAKTDSTRVDIERIGSTVLEIKLNGKSIWS